MTSYYLKEKIVRNKKGEFITSYDIIRSEGKGFETTVKLTNKGFQDWVAAGNEPSIKYLDADDSVWGE
jgi:hypothetical protein